jgi:hypothetical protein
MSAIVVPWNEIVRGMILFEEIQFVDSVEKVVVRDRGNNIVILDYRPGLKNVARFKNEKGLVRRYWNDFPSYEERRNTPWTDTEEGKPIDIEPPKDAKFVLGETESDRIRGCYHGTCPRCERFVSTVIDSGNERIVRYCPHCGQPIRWRAEDVTEMMSKLSGIFDKLIGKEC